MRAFALMRPPAELEAVFVSSPHYQRGKSFFESLRATLPSGLGLRYRGIGRFPLTEYPERGPGWQGQATSDDGEGRARQLLVEFLDPEDLETPYPRAFLYDRNHAAAVQAALSRPQAFELVELCVHPETAANALGFDVGYWGGGNFSVLCDCAIWPVWHPAIPSAIPDLARHVSRLNHHALFPTDEVAGQFLAWYAEQPWAEDSEDLRIVAVGACSEPG